MMPVRRAEPWRRQQFESVGVILHSGRKSVDPMYVHTNILLDRSKGCAHSIQASSKKLRVEQSQGTDCRVQTANKRLRGENIMESGTSHRKHKS